MISKYAKMRKIRRIFFKFPNTNIKIVYDVNILNQTNNENNTISGLFRNYEYNGITGFTYELFSHIIIENRIGDMYKHISISNYEICEIIDSLYKIIQCFYKYDENSFVKRKIPLKFNTLAIKFKKYEDILKEDMIIFTKFENNEHKDFISLNKRESWYMYYALKDLSENNAILSNSVLNTYLLRYMIGLVEGDKI